MELIRELYYILVKFNLEFHAIHLRSEQNYVADAINRLDYVKFHAVRPKADRYMYPPADSEFYGSVV